MTTVTEGDRKLARRWTDCRCPENLGGHECVPGEPNPGEELLALEIAAHREAAVAEAVAQHVYMPDPVRCLDCAGPMHDSRHAESLALMLQETDDQLDAEREAGRKLAEVLEERVRFAEDGHQGLTPADYIDQRVAIHERMVAALDEYRQRQGPQ